MVWVSFETDHTHMPPPPLSPDGGLDSKISPSILLIIVVVASVFFISGLLHLLVRYLLRPTNRDIVEDRDDVTALQGRLQQLFHLHDGGVDQSFIDTLPVFLYGAVTGVKDPFDCAVCLSEFASDDELRLLPACSHAFHVECIDTWLLSHSTCPLCRSSLLPEVSPGPSRGPVGVVLESGGESSREILADGDSTVNAHNEEDLGSSINEAHQETGETGTKEEAEAAVVKASEPPAVVVPVKLGKFRNVEASGGTVGERTGAGDGNVDGRRCFSMGAFEYVMDESALLRVAIRPPERNSTAGKKPGHRPAVSECDGNPRREGFRWFPPASSAAQTRWEHDGGDAHIAANSRHRESFSVSKIWQRSRKEKPASAEVGSRRAVSFRLPLQRSAASEEPKTKCGGAGSRRTAAAPEIYPAGGLEKERGEVVSDGEAGGGGGRVLSRSEETPSFARRTLLWIAGRHHKVVNHV